jgi:biopolymer transport protein ExbB
MELFSELLRTGVPIWELLRIGGPIILILVVLSIVAFTISIVKLLQFSKAKLFSSNSAAAIADALGAMRQDNIEYAQQRLVSSKSPLSMVLQTVLRLRQQNAEEELLREEAERIANFHLVQLRRQLQTLEVIALISPLLGLLGTVIGMITAFQQLQQGGAVVDPKVLSGGIWEALLTTAAGLIVAIPATLMFNWFRGCTDRFQQLAEDVLTQTFTYSLYRSEGDSLQVVR